MRSTRASEDCMRPSARLFGLTRFGIACEDALGVCSLIERDLSWRLPVCMDVHVDVGDAIMPALRVQRDTYCRFRAAYGLVGRRLKLLARPTTRRNRTRTRTRHYRRTCSLRDYDAYTSVSRSP